METDTLTPTDYLEIMQELRGYDPAADTYAVTIRAFIERIESTYSVGQWSKLQRGALNRIPWPMKNELRRAVGMQNAPLVDAHDVAEQIAAGKLPFRVENGTVFVGSPRKQGRPRPKRMAVSLPPAEGAALNEARRAAGLTWAEVAELAAEVLRERS